MAVDIKILKNSPKLNSEGQYRLTDAGENLSVSSDENNKFLDDDLYTTADGNVVNEEIIDENYSLVGDPRVKLTIKMKNKVSHGIRNIRFRVGLNGGSEDNIDQDFDGWEPYTNGNYRIFYWQAGQESEGWSPGTMIDDAEIITNFGTTDYSPSEGTYDDTYSTHASSGYEEESNPSGYDVSTFKLSAEDWGNIEYNDTSSYFQVYVYSHGDSVRWYGNDPRDSRIDVIRFRKRDFKYDLDNGICDEVDDDNSGGNEYNKSNAYPDCWRQPNGTYRKGLRYEYDSGDVSPQSADDEWEHSGTNNGDKSSPFKVVSARLKIIPPFQTDAEEIESDYAIDYQKFLVNQEQYLTSWTDLNVNRVINYPQLKDDEGIELNNFQLIDFKPISYVYPKNSEIDLQQYYFEPDDKFKTSAPAFVDFKFEINKISNTYDLESYNDDGRFAFAYFVIDWNDKNNKFKTWEDVFDDYPTSYSKLYEKQQEKNTYILAGVDGYGKNVNEFSPIEPLNHFYQTPGLKTIKSIVFSYGTNNNGLIQALRWKLVTTTIYLNQNRTSQQDFSELGAFEFTTIPWPYTAPIISGITKLSRYYDSIENVLFNNQFSDEELSSEAQVYNALINDELGDFIGDVDIEQTRFFSNAYDMDELLMLYESLDDEYNPYYDIYDVETNMFGYWGTGENFYPDFDESCVGLIFISDSSNNNLKRDCLIELNMGDVENDNIIDTSGNKNIGITIGDYSVEKRSTLVPLTRNSDMKLPETENEDRAI